MLDSIRLRRCRYIYANNNPAYPHLPALPKTYFLKLVALAWLGPEFTEIDLSFLSLILFIAVIASATQLVEMAVEKFSPSLYASLGIFLPLIAVNCAILGCSLFHVGMRPWFCWDSSCLRCWLWYRLASAIGRLVGIRERLAYSNVPKPLRGIGITLIITGLTGIAFMSFLGIKI